MLDGYQLRSLSILASNIRSLQLQALRSDDSSTRRHAYLALAQLVVWPLYYIVLYCRVYRCWRGREAWSWTAEHHSW